MIAITPKGERTYVCRDELLIPDSEQTLKYGLLGSTDENPLVGEGGKKVPDPTPSTIDDYLSMLRWDVKEELCLAIQEGLSMTKDEVEKPEPPQSA
jgi:hypothetical protein